MKFVEVTCKQRTISASVSPRPPETWLLTARLFLTLQAVTPSSPTVSLPPTRSPAKAELALPASLPAPRCLLPPLPRALPTHLLLPSHVSCSSLLSTPVPTSPPDASAKPWCVARAPHPCGGTAGCSSRTPGHGSCSPAGLRPDHPPSPGSEPP